ncbi:MAG: hypothetical protein ACJAZS_000399 [Alteromonas naphthalenivorans]|jgi:hypothetical protein
MKKILLATLIFACSQQTLQAEDTNSLNLVAENYDTSFIDLPLGSQAGAASIGLIAGAYTFILTRAIENIFYPNYEPINLLNIKDWTKAQCVTTPVVTGFVATWLAGEFKPEVSAQRANENGLLDLVLTSETNEEVLNNLDAKYVVERFPRAASFVQLTTLRNALTHLLDITTRFNTKRPKRNFDSIRAALVSNLKKVDTAMLVVKQDARWLQECNAQTMNNIHTTQDNQFKVDLAGAAINIAHAYSNRR